MTTQKNESKYASLEHASWTIHDEEAFVEQLGSHTKNSLPRPVLLAKYINFMTTTRVNFVRMDKGHLIEYAKKALKGIK